MIRIKKREELAVWRQLHPEAKTSSGNKRYVSFQLLMFFTNFMSGCVLIELVRQAVLQVKVCTKT